jgi:periplasmic protein CpxP/Spy
MDGDNNLEEIPMRTKIWIVAGIAIVAVALGLGVLGWAQEEHVREVVRTSHGMPGQGMGMGMGMGMSGEDQMGGRLLAVLDNDRIKSALGLTDQQVDRLRNIVVETEKTSVKNRAEIEVRGIELRELLRADNSDRDAVMKKVQEISGLRGEMMQRHVAALLDAKAVLTPEQQKKVRTFVESRMETRGLGGPENRMFFGGDRRGGPPAPPAPPQHPDGPPNP